VQVVNWLIGGSIAVVILAGLVRWVLPPYRYNHVKSEDLKTYLEVLLWRGFNNGYIVIEIDEPPQQRRLIQFAKYIRASGKAGLELVFPLADWSRLHYNGFKEILTAKEIPFRAHSRDADEVQEAVFVDVQQDLVLAYDLCCILLAEVFSITENECSINVTLHNVSPRNVRHGE